MFLLLGIVAGASPAFGEMLLLESLRDSFQEATAALRQQGIDVSEKRVRSVALAIGRLSLEARERRLAALQVKVDSGSPVDGGRPSCRGKRLAVAMDGGRVLIRTNNKGRRTAKGFHTYRTDWREPKLFIIYELDDAGRKKRRSMVKCDGTIGNPDALVRLLVAELRSIGADEAETVVFLGDGAKWIWNRIPDIARQAGISDVRRRVCLDYYHAVEHLGIIAAAKAFTSGKDRQKWIERMKKQLKTVSPSAFLAELAKSRRKGNTVIRREYTYFQNNMSAIDYATLIKARLPIGSGSIESAVRRVVNLRIKAAGTFWTLENAEAMLHLRCQLKSNNWKEFYDELLANMAA